MIGFDDLYRQGGALTWQAGKEDVVRQVADLLMDLGPESRIVDFGCGTGWTAPILTRCPPAASPPLCARRRWARRRASSSGTPNGLVR